MTNAEIFVWGSVGAAATYGALYVLPIVVPLISARTSNMKLMNWIAMAGVGALFAVIGGILAIPLTAQGASTNETISVGDSILIGATWQFAWKAATAAVGEGLKRPAGTTAGRTAFSPQAPPTTAENPIPLLGIERV